MNQINNNDSFVPQSNGHNIPTGHGSDVCSAPHTLREQSCETHQEFFVVQKCWFDGPLLEPPVDYLALFTKRSDADNVAYQSAHAFAAEHHAVVRTLILTESGYAFSTAGKLFWVRSVYASLAPQQQKQATTNHGAHVILTKGVIGGYGGRRGTEIAYNRVFVGPESSTMALTVLNRGDLPPGSMISWIPFGPLPENNLLQGWSLTSSPDTTMEDTIGSTTGKRPVIEGQQQFHYHATAARPSKRHRDTMDMCI
jgi:hypothetical protein